MVRARSSRCWPRSLVIVLSWVLLLGLSPSIAMAAAAPDEPRSLTVDPSSGPPGTSVTVRGTGWDPEYYSTGVRVGFYQNFGNGVLTSYADERSVQPDDKGRFSFGHTIPDGFADGDILTFSGLIGNGGGERANFTVAGGGSSGGQGGSSGGAGTGSQADLKPTSITYDKEKATQFGAKIYFDSGIENGGGTATEVFNIKWFVDGKEVGAYGSHAGVPAGTTVLDGNSQFEWSFLPSRGSTR